MFRETVGFHSNALGVPQLNAKIRCIIQILYILYGISIYFILNKVIYQKTYRMEEIKTRYFSSFNGNKIIFLSNFRLPIVKILIKIYQFFFSFLLLIFSFLPLRSFFSLVLVGGASAEIIEKFFDKMAISLINWVGPQVMLAQGPTNSRSALGDEPETIVLNFYEYIRMNGSNWNPRTVITQDWKMV